MFNISSQPINSLSIHNTKGFNVKFENGHKLSLSYHVDSDTITGWVLADENDFLYLGMNNNATEEQEKEMEEYLHSILLSP